jgi:hypothetical protein
VNESCQLKSRLHERKAVRNAKECNHPRGWFGRQRTSVARKGKEKVKKVKKHPAYPGTHSSFPSFSQINRVLQYETSANDAARGTRLYPPSLAFQQCNKDGPDGTGREKLGCKQGRSDEHYVCTKHAKHQSPSRVSRAVRTAIRARVQWP